MSPIPLAAEPDAAEIAPRRTRARFAINTTVLVVAAAVSLVVVNLLADRYTVRLDVTATREQALSPRTRQLLGSLTGTYEIVVAADWAAIDRRAARRVRDVLDLFEKGLRGGEGRVQTTVIDTATAAGGDEFRSLLTRLAEREGPRIAEQTRTVEAAIEAAKGLADALVALAPRLGAVREAIPESAPGAENNRRFFEYQASTLHSNAGALRDIATKAGEALAKRDGPLPIADLDGAAGPLRRALGDLDSGLRTLADAVRQFSEAAEQPGAARDAAGGVAREIVERRNTAAVQSDALARLGSLDAARVARTLREREAAIVIGPPGSGVTAIPFDWLFPASADIDAAGDTQADMRRRTEEMLAVAVDSLARPVNPIVVLVHAWPLPRLLDGRGFRSLVERLGLRGIDVVEWPTAVQADAPGLTALNPRGDRPVVYVGFQYDTTGGTTAGLSGPQRAERLGAVLNELAARGEALLLSIAPSTLPTFGSPDPTVAMLPMFGLEADSARPLLRESITPDGRLVIPEHVLLPLEPSAAVGDSEQPVLAAIRGLRTLFEWPVSMRVLNDDRGARSQVWPLYTVSTQSTWGESEWLRFWQLRPPASQPRVVQESPQPEASRDSTVGPWVVAAAAERALPSGGGSQRLIAVGSNTWFTDRVCQQPQAMVDGRIATAFPGNAEFFEAAVYWLAKQDGRIGASATARAVPVIKSLTPGTLAMLRWLVIAGLPVATLGAGVCWRLTRG